MHSIWGTTTQTHGGVIPQNVRVEENGDVTIAVNGDYYAGDKKGVSVYDHSGQADDGTSTGGVVMTKRAYGPGSFEVVMKIPSVNGVCTSLWLYNNWSDGDGEANNHEIDIELHGTVGSGDSLGTYRKALFTSWLTETVFESDYIDVGYPLNDGQFHTYRIDWHTGANARVEYYIDGVLLATQTRYIPNNEMYVNIGCWFPNDWCGQPNFETDTMVIRSFAYTPFIGESAGTANTDTVSEREYAYYALPVSGAGFESNLLANGGFDASRNNFMWTFTDTPQKQDGAVTFTGSMTQDVELDCGGLELELILAGTGNASVVISFGSIVDGVAVTGEQTFAFSNGGTFKITPPANCTELTVTVIASNSVTLTDAKLAVKGAAQA